jgi:effector-binding domain-containing protein
MLQDTKVRRFAAGGVAPIRRSAMLRLRFVVLASAIAAFAAIQPSPLRAQATVHTESIDPFGQEVALTDKPIVYITGTGEWDSAYATLTEAYKTLQAYLDKAGIKAAGPAMTIYTAMDDMSFNFQASIPVAAKPAAPQGNIGIGESPAGKVLKFVHRGSFDAMTQTYDSIAHYVDEKQISTKELLIEEYVTDLLNTPAETLVINIFVPLN